MKKQACKNCKSFSEGNECTNCHSGQLTPNWKGRLFILDNKKSQIAKKIGITKDGEYAIKVN